MKHGNVPGAVRVLIRVVDDDPNARAVFSHLVFHLSYYDIVVSVFMTK
jgi:hypothetical protein